MIEDQPSGVATHFADMRYAMVVSQLRPSGVFDQRVLAAMGSVAREGFVPADYASVAYMDRPIPLWSGRALNPPVVTALLFDAAQITVDARVLIIGAATGYSLAVAVLLSDDVTGVEIDERMVKVAGEIAGVRLVVGSLEAGVPDRAPYDVIVIDGAVEAVPDALIAQLAPDGRLACAVVEHGIARLGVGRRGGTGFALAGFAESEAVSLPGFAKPEVFQF